MKIFLSCMLFFAVVHSIPATKRATVELWGTCNEPSIGINGPLQCVDGSQCICKDDTFAQCRQPINGVWSDDPSWHCQKPGDMPGTSNPASGGSTPSSGGNPVPPPSNPAPSVTSSQAGPGPTGSAQTGSISTGEDLTSTYANASASVGGCSNVVVPGGWDGVASTSYYGYMGTACMCGNANFEQASWQSNTGESLGIGQGIYSGAVNQKLFGGTLNSAGQPGCGPSCGVCYELMTTGVNAYNDGTKGGSTIQMMVVDACYGAAKAPNWCSSNTASGLDDFGCGAHFDIDTDPTAGNVPAIGQDGTTWQNGGQMVLYRRTACPSAMTDAFNQDCKSHC